MLLFCVFFNLAVLQPVVGGRKVMENVFWMESHAEPAHFLPQGDAGALQPGPRHHGGPTHGPVTLGVRQ